MPFRNGNIVPNATRWTDEMISFLRDNYQKMTNKQLADSLSLKLTVTRNKLRELGLKRMTLEYWSDEMVEFLKKSYKTIGDVEIMHFFIKHHPKAKGWKRGAIRKKRKQLGLMRTPAESKMIAIMNSKKGGRSYTIERNSSSRNMHPMWVAQRIAWRNSALASELVKHPEIIESARALILLKRAIKNAKVEKK